MNTTRVTTYNQFALALYGAEITRARTLIVVVGDHVTDAMIRETNKISNSVPEPIVAVIPHDNAPCDVAIQRGVPVIGVSDKENDGLLVDIVRNMLERISNGIDVYVVADNSSNASMAAILINTISDAVSTDECPRTRLTQRIAYAVQNVIKHI